MKKNTNVRWLELWGRRTIIVMRNTFILLILFASNLIANTGYSQNMRFNISTSNMTLGQLFSEIEKESEFSIIYKSNEVDVKENVLVDVKQQTVDIILNNVLKKQGLKYTINDEHIIIYKPKTSEANAGSAIRQDRKKTTGIIKDQAGVPIIGASIAVKGQPIGVMTDVDGLFSLDIPNNATTLVISYIGFSPQEIAVGDKIYFDITLIEDTKLLDEVVVTALGIKRSEKALGYSVQKVKGETLSTVKGVDMASSLTGKVAGMQVSNSTEFGEVSAISLRGENPLIVIDGVAYSNITLRDVASDDIESIDVLKGATASALYGSRGDAGAIMVTTKRGSEEGLKISVNSSTMFESGFLRLPKPQSSYSAGGSGKYSANEYVWGDKLDIGRTAEQYNPLTKQWEKDTPLTSRGKDNFKNFLESSFVTNNNVSVSQKGKYGSFRTSLTHVYNKGQYPNNRLNKITYTVAGTLEFNGFVLDGGITYNKRYYPTNYGTGYGQGGYIYNMLVWSGAEYDIRDYKDYWVEKDKVQSWPTKVDLDNPYFIANEILQSSNYDVLNGFANASFKITPWLKTSLRLSVEAYTERETWRNPIGTRGGGWSKKGYFEEKRTNKFSTSNDFMLAADHKFGDFAVDGFAGGSIYYLQNDYIGASTKNGISIPGYYSVKASVDPANVSTDIKKKQINSVYGKLTASWKNMLYLDATARNDWSSTLPSETRSYFYPSVGGSFIASEIVPMPEWISFWKLRASWTKSKKDLSIYEINSDYSINTSVWNNQSGATYPVNIRDPFIRPNTTRSYELGTNLNFLKNRIRFDLTYYNKLYYNRAVDAPISDTSGFEYFLLNTKEELVRKGVEISLSADVVTGKDFSWTTMVNWSSDRLTYAKLDPEFSSNKDWVKVGKRADYYTYNDWERNSDGDIAHYGGLPVQNKYLSLAGYTSPDWMFGFSNTFKYKNFTLGISIDGRVGGVAHSVTQQALWLTGAHEDSNTQERYEEVVNGNITFVGKGVNVVSGSAQWDANGKLVKDDRVFEPNSKTMSYETYIKRYNGAGNVWNAKHQNILDQTFIKLRELSITYDIPKSLSTKLKIDGASISFIGHNVLLWTKDFKFSDPDKSFTGSESGVENLNSPSLRMLGCNIKVNF